MTAHKISFTDSIVPSARYLFVSTTVSSCVTMVSTLVFVFMAEGVFGFKIPELKQEKFWGRKIIPLVRSKAFLAGGVMALPLGTAQFADAFAGRAFGFDRPPGLALLAGWLGSTVALGTASYMTQIPFWKNVCIYKRFCVANKLGSCVAASSAIAMSAAHTKLKQNRFEKGPIS